MFEYFRAGERDRHQRRDSYRLPFNDGNLGYSYRTAALNMITKTLSEFVVGTNYDDIPDHEIASAKKAILDYLGVAIAGSTANTGRVVTEYVRGGDGVPEAV